MFLGSWKIDDYVPIPVTCHRFSSGAAYAPSALTYSIYEDGGTTGIAEDVDMTPASPHDSVVGFYLARPQLTAASGFEKGKNYTVLIKATVDSISAIATHTFQIEAEVDANVVSGSVLLQATQTGVTIPTVTTVTNGVTLADDAITNAKFDETSAFPVKSADTGATQIARVGADSDTLETLSDEIAAVKAETAAIVEDTGTTLDTLVKDIPTNSELATALGTADDAVLAVLTAIKGVGWATETLVAINAFVSPLETKIDTISDNVDTVDGIVDDILTDTGTTLDTLIKDIPTNAELATALGTADDAVLAAIATSKTVIDDIHDTDLPAVKSDTAAILTDTGTTLPATLTTIEGKVDTVDTVVDAIKTETDTHPTAAEVWANTTRTLTNAGVSVTSPATGDPLEIYKDSTVVISLTALGSIAGLDQAGDKLYFTAKENLDDADSSAIIQIYILAPGAGTPGADTLTYINGAAATATDGIVTIVDKTTGAINITLYPAAADDLPIYAATPLYWDVKTFDDETIDVVHILQTGTMYIYGTATKSIT
jgi:hypothetical protein